MPTIHHPERGRIDLTIEQSALLDFALANDYLEWRYPFDTKEHHMRYVIVKMTGASNEQARRWLDEHGP